MAQVPRLIPRSLSAWVLLAVLGAGALVRFWLMLQWRPAFFGYADSIAYMLDAFENYPFFDPLRVVGYGVFIRELHDLRPDLSLVTLTQHGLGLATALMLYLTVRVADVRSRWIGVFAAAVVALGGAQIMFEHALLSESLWQFLITAAVLAVVGAAKLGGLDLARTRWAAIAIAVVGGLLLGLSVTVRLTGVFVIPLMVFWVAAATPTTRWARVGLASALLVSAIVPIYALASWQQAETGRFGVTRNGAMNFYGRVAPWADCTKFTPPAGTEELCETTPRSARPGHEVYIFGTSPAMVRWQVGGLTAVLPPEGVEQLTSWSRAAVLGQPLTYLDAVASESARLIDPGVYPGFSKPELGGYGLGPEAYPLRLRNIDPPGSVIGVWRDHYPGGGEQKTAPLTGFYRYEYRTRIPPAVMAALFALALLAPFAARGPERRLAWLVTPAALLLLVMPIVTSMYDFRYTVPVYGFLAIASAIGGWAVVTSFQGWVRHRGGRKVVTATGRRGSVTQ